MGIGRIAGGRGNRELRSVAVAVAGEEVSWRWRGWGCRGRWVESRLSCEKGELGCGVGGQALGCLGRDGGAVPLRWDEVAVRLGFLVFGFPLGLGSVAGGSSCVEAGSGTRYVDLARASRYVEVGSGSRCIEPVSGSSFIDLASGTRYIELAGGTRYIEPVAESRYIELAGGTRYVESWQASRLPLGRPLSTLTLGRRISTLPVGRPCRWDAVYRP